MSRRVACLAGLSITKLPFDNQLKNLKKLCFEYQDILNSLQANEDTKVRSKCEKIKNKIYKLFWDRNGDHNGVFITSLIEIGDIDILMKWINGQSFCFCQETPSFSDNQQ